MAEGAKHFSDMLTVNTTLTSVKYAAVCPNVLVFVHKRLVADVLLVLPLFAALGATSLVLRELATFLVRSRSIQHSRSSSVRPTAKCACFLYKSSNT